MIRVICISMLLVSAMVAGGADVYRMGVLAHRGKDVCRKQWSPLAKYLTGRISGAEFVIVPLNFDEIDKAIERKEVDLLLVNPAITANAEAFYEIRPLVTLKNKSPTGKSFDVFGSVIFCKKSESMINNLSDLKSYSFMAVDKDSFGGWLTIKDLLRRNRIDPDKEFKSLLFGKTHDAVVEAVNNGTVAAGCVRTGILEELNDQGKIRLDDFKIINRIDYPTNTFGFVCSTPLYPEWALLEVADRGLGTRLSMELMQMPESFADKMGGWTIPLCYSHITECLKNLHYGPYSNETQMNITKIWMKNKVIISLLVGLIVLLLAFMVYMKRSKSVLRQYANKLLSDINELSQMTRKLDESEQQFRLLFQHAISGIALHQIVLNEKGIPVDYICLRANHAYEQQLGIAQEQLVGHRATSCFSAEDIQPLVVIFGEVVNTGMSREFDYYIGGLNKWFHMHAYKTGSMQFSLLIYDITEKKRQEDELKQRHEQFRLAVEGSNDGIWDWDLRTDKIYFSPQWKRMLGYEDDELNNEFSVIEEHLHPDEREKVLDYVKRYLNGEFKTYDMEFRFRHKNGSYIWVLSRGKAIYNDQGRPCRMAGSHSDITFRKQAAEELNAIYENIPMIIILLDQNFYIRKANRIAEKFMGDSNDYIGKLNGEGLRCIYAGEAGCGQTEHCKECSLRCTVKDTLKTGHNHNQIETNITLVDSQGHKPVEMVILFSSILIHVNEEPMVLICIMDITDRKIAEEKLNKAIVHLKKTNVRLKEQRVLAQDMMEHAKIADKTKNEFLSCMSHELRTPMNGIIGMTSLLADTALSGLQLQYVTMLQSSGRTLLTLINDILDFSKLNEKKLTLECIDFNFIEMIENSIDCLNLDAQKKGLEMNFLIDPAIPTFLNGDSFRIQQVVNNLTSNAVKFTESGEVTINIELLRKEDDGITIFTKISDTGIGIPSANITQLFQPFNQGDSSICRKFGGTGLGLAICRQLIDLMHGEIGCDSVEDKGSTFWFKIKLKKAKKSDADETAELHDLELMKILIAVYSPTAITMMNTLLGRWNCRVTDVYNLKKMFTAMDDAANAGAPFDVIIVDENVLGAEEDELRQKCRKKPRSSLTRLVKMIYPQDVVSLNMSLWDGYLVKPIKPSRLYECISQVKKGKFHAEQEVDIAPSRSTPEERKINGEKVRILLVEDDATNQAVAVAIISSWGFQVDTSVNGQEAVNLVRSISYDLVVMDCQMPVMDGFEATRCIREEEKLSGGKHVTIIAMTANALQGDRERCLKAGMDDYIAKPINIDDLRKKLLAWLPEVPPLVKLEMPSGDNEIFCEAEVMGRLMDNRELVQTVLEGFLGDIPTQITKLKGYITGDDMVNARYQSHTIKGASANVGAHRLFKAAEKLEGMIKQSDYNEIINMLSLLEREFEVLKNELTAQRWA